MLLSTEQPMSSSYSSTWQSTSNPVTRHMQPSRTAMLHCSHDLFPWGWHPSQALLRGPLFATATCARPKHWRARAPQPRPERARRPKRDPCCLAARGLAPCRTAAQRARAAAPARRLRASGRSPRPRPPPRRPAPAPAAAAGRPVRAREHRGRKIAKLARSPSSQDRSGVRKGCPPSTARSRQRLFSCMAGRVLFLHQMTRVSKCGCTLSMAE